MKLLRRRACFPLIISATLAAFLPAGCVRPSEDDQYRIHFSIWGSVHQQKAEQEIIQAFQEQVPEVSVQLSAIGSRYAEKIQAMFVGNVAPDVMMVSLINYDDWASRGVLEDLTDLFHELNDESEFMPIPRRAVERNGRIYGIPINAHGHATYYNKDALSQAGIEIPQEGLTWSFLEEIAPRLSRRHGNRDAPTDYVLMLPPTSFILWQHGTQLFDDLHHPSHVTVNSPESHEALEFVRRMHASGFAVPPEVATDEGTFQLFRDGRIAFYFSGRWMTPEFAGRTDFEWDVTPMPAGPASNITGHGGTILAISKNSRRKDAARKFLRFYASPAGNRIAMHWQRNVPVYREVAFSDEFLNLRPPENIIHFAQTMEEGAAQFALYAPGGAEVDRLVTARVQQAISEPELSTEAVLAGLESDLERWLQRMKERGNL